jgi:PAT family beta-lactamase induction signal transducer AmpG
MAFSIVESSTIHSPLDEPYNEIFSSLENDTGEVFVVTVDGTNLRFSPDTITLKEGDTVNFLWENQLLPHNAVEENGLFDSGDPERNVDYSYTFNLGENGTYQYECEPHADLGMVGTIIVQPLPVVEPEPEPENQSEDDDEVLAVGTGEIPSLLFTPWFIGMFVLVGFITIRRDDFQMNLVLEDDSDTIVAELADSEGETLVDSYRARVFTLCALYVAQGIPWGFMTVTFVTYLAAEGVAAEDLALLLTLGTLPWSLKFLWGPVIDRYQYPPMGRRRPWILLAQSGMILTLILLSFIASAESDIQVIAAMFLVYNIFTSLQDVSTDALAVDVLKTHELEKVNSYMFTSKAVGGMIGGAGLGMIISYTGIKGALVMQIPILLVIMMVPLFMRERPGEKLFPWSEEDGSKFVEADNKNQNFSEFIGKVKTAFSLKSTRLGIVLSLVLSLSFFLVPVLPLLFIRELGWSQEQFNATKGGLILILTMFAYIVGGHLGRLIGGKSVIIYASLAGAIITAVWGLTEVWWGNSIFMLTIWSIRTFVFAMVSINVFSLMMRITWSEVGGTQFTAYMAMMNLSAIIGYQLTEPLAGRFDYPTLFLIAAVLETLLIGAALYIDPDETRRELGDESVNIATGMD